MTDIERGRLKAKASGMARSALIERHRDEYNQLYRFYSEQLGVADNRHINRDRPKAPDYEP